jgi:UDP-3-O-[3-hydroxymyristoyl] glucosamine N-acyltransferase
MTVPGSWRGSPTGDPGAFSFFFYCDDLSTTWREINVRDASLLAGADVAQQLAAAGVTADEAEAAAVIRTVSVQNLDNADGVEYSRWAAVGTTDPPTPPSAKAVALPNGAVIFDGARIEPGAVVERSIVGFGARIGPRALIRDGVVGDGADIGARCELLRGARVWPGILIPDCGIRYSSDI